MRKPFCDICGVEIDSANLGSIGGRVSHISPALRFTPRQHHLPDPYAPVGYKKSPFGDYNSPRTIRVELRVLRARNTEDKEGDYCFGCLKKVLEFAAPAGEGSPAPPWSNDDWTGGFVVDQQTPIPSDT